MLSNVLWIQNEDGSSRAVEEVDGATVRLFAHPDGRHSARVSIGADSLEGAEIAAVSLARALYDELLEEVSEELAATYDPEVDYAR